MSHSVALHGAKTEKFQWPKEIVRGLLADVL